MTDAIRKSDAEYWLSESDFAAIPAIEERPVEGRAAPQASVLMLAYNHGPFIGKAIESVLGQDCDSPFELLIGEDQSSDDTLAVCRDYVIRYPGRIRLVTSPENVGMHLNFGRLWYLARADLLAFCEGDDYWTDSSKLQRQLDWFAHKPDGALCGSDCERLVRGDGGIWRTNGLAMQAPEKETYTFEDLIRRYTFHFSTVMVRKSRIHFPRWFWDCYCVDRPLYLLAAQSGEAGHIGGVTSGYREHEGGAWSHKPALDKAASSRALFTQIEQYLAPEYRDTVRDTLSGILWSYMSEALESCDDIAARKLFWQVLAKGLPRSIRQRTTMLPIVFVRTHLPSLYRMLRPAA